MCMCVCVRARAKPNLSQVTAHVICMIYSNIRKDSEQVLQYDKLII